MRSVNGKLSTMDTNLTHLEQYKMLRDEIMQHVREIYRTELVAAIAAGSVYAWLLLHRQDAGATSPAAWFIAPGLLVACALRCVDLIVRIKGIAKYLRTIEEVAFRDDSKLPGWERYKVKRSWHDITSVVLAALLWLVVIGGSISGSWLLSREPNLRPSKPNSPSRLNPSAP